MNTNTARKIFKIACIICPITGLIHCIKIRKSNKQNSDQLCKNCYQGTPTRSGKIFCRLHKELKEKEDGCKQ